MDNPFVIERLGLFVPDWYINVTGCNTRRGRNLLPAPAIWDARAHPARMRRTHYQTRRIAQRGSGSGSEGRCVCRQLPFQVVNLRLKTSAMVALHMVICGFAYLIYLTPILPPLE